jgi:hypothetical protein
MSPLTYFNLLVMQLVNECYLRRIDLSAHGFYITPDIGMDWATGKGRPFSYFTFGAACAVAEIDTLTGDFHLPRVDIVMDLGHSLNPAIDIGQVEGGYVQGLGWTILEELKWGDPAHPWVRPGHLFTQGPGTYKIPTVNDIPIDFRVSLLKVRTDTSHDLIFRCDLELRAWLIHEERSVQLFVFDLRRMHPIRRRFILQRLWVSHLYFWQLPPSLPSRLPFRRHGKTLAIRDGLCWTHPQHRSAFAWLALTSSRGPSPSQTFGRS